MSGTDPRSNTMPEENAVSSRTTPHGPEPTPRDKSPEHQFKPRQGEGNNFTPGSDTPKGPVNITVKDAAGDAPGQPDELAAPDEGVSDEARARATGRGKADAGSLPEE